MFYIRDDFSEYGEKELERDMTILPLWRRKQAEKFRFFQGKRDCTVSYLMLCEGLEKEYGIKDKPTFVIGKHGKPTLKEYPEIHFNLSHCKEAIACIIDTKTVGIDVESIGRKHNGIVDFCMNEEEARLIRESENQEVTFTELWTKKEALLKCLGTGITDEIKDVLKKHLFYPPDPLHDSPPHKGRTMEIEIETIPHIEKNYIMSIAKTSL